MKFGLDLALLIIMKRHSDTLIYYWKKWFGGGEQKIRRLNFVVYIHRYHFNAILRHGSLLYVLDYTRAACTKRRPAMAWYLNTDDTDDETKYQPMDSLQVI